MPHAGETRRSTTHASRSGKRIFSLDSSPTLAPAAASSGTASSTSPTRKSTLSISTAASSRSRSRSSSGSRRSSSAFEPLLPPALDASSSFASPVTMAVDAAPPPANGTTTNGTGTPHKSRSILNLTSSTLLGIYSPTGYDTNRDDPGATPWGTGAQTPARTPSIDARAGRPQVPSRADFGPGPAAAARLATQQRARSFHGQAAAAGGASRPAAMMTGRARRGHVRAALVRVVVLFSIGVAYGMLITHLHDARGIAPVRVDLGVRRGRGYLAFWGVMGVLLGTLLPWLDTAWEGRAGEDGVVEVEQLEEKNGHDGRARWPDMAGTVRSGLGADWNPVVRSVGAFVGIAFAIRKLPWQSTLQVSLTLALVNPVIWYLIDRSKPGFLLSTAVGVTGAAVLFSINPDVVPAPATPSPREFATKIGSGPRFGAAVPHGLIGGVISYESIGVATWISSVLFCSCVCFGNIGRRLAWTAAPVRAQQWS